jgi:hypothetical protein
LERSFWRGVNFAGRGGFLADHRAHPASYRAGSLPDLPLDDDSFDLVLCGHLLFAYAPLADGGIYQGDGFDLAWHPCPG